MWVWRITCFIVAAVCFASMSMAQEPPVTAIKPDIPIYPSYFSTLHASDRSLYVGHYGGVASYDGARWKNIPLSFPGAVRELRQDRNGRIWAGGTDTFGYITRAANGSETYVDVAAQFADAIGGVAFADVWRTLERDDGIYFGALHYVFHVDFEGRAVRHWHNPGRFGELANVQGELWMQWRGEGLKRLRGDTWEMVPGGEAFFAPLIYNLLPLPNGQVLLHSVKPWVGVWDGSGFRKLEWLTEHEDVDLLVNALVLQDGSVAFGGSDGVARIADFATQTLQPLAVAPTFISQIAEDADGALLAVSMSGVHRFHWPSAWTIFDEDAGIRGVVYEVVEHEDALYVLSGAGVYVADMVDGEPVLPFRRRSWTGNEAWDLLPTESGLLLAASQGLRLPNANSAPRTGPEALYPRVLVPHQTDPSLLWIGTEHGPSLFRQSDDGWELVAKQHRMGELFNSAVHGPDGSMWFGTGGQGLFQVGYTGGDELAVRRVGKMDGLLIDEEGPAWVSHTSLGALVSTGNGIFRHLNGQFVADDLGGLSDVIAADEILKFKELKDGSLWAQSYRALYRREADRWSRFDLTTLDRGVFEASALDANGTLWLGGLGALLRLEPERLSAQRNGASMALIGAGIEIGDDLARLDLTNALEAPGGSGGLHFEYALSDLSSSESTRYRYRLMELDETWSAWTDTAETVYRALPPGHYTLQAQAQDVAGKQYDADEVSFSILPKWYERPMLQLAGLLLALLGAIAITRWTQRRKLRRLARANEALEEVVRERTMELQEANARLRGEAERDALTGIGNRRFFDKKMAAAIAAAKTGQEPLALLMIDVDHFKMFNDTKGHQAGDELLKELALVLSESLRRDTVVARYGGEEFAIIAESCTLDWASALARRMVRRVERKIPGTTISVGYASFDASRDDSPQSLIERADAALYEAKRKGRNRAVLAA